jgi:8-oxo-dGTP pyrophosphatase MutT (NUDIX family)
LTRLSFDPHTFPLDSIAGEAPLPPARLREAWLRTRFANPPDWIPENIIDPRLNALPERRAAVLIPIVLHEEEPTLILTLRTSTLRSHAGQISFPGGGAENSDTSLTDTALRETEEEIGLSRDNVDVLGALPDYVTGTGYRVTPVVGLVHPPFVSHPDPGEVAEIFEVPLTFLMNGMHHQRRLMLLPEGMQQRLVYAMHYERFFIWGATAGMLRNLYHFLRV